MYISTPIDFISLIKIPPLGRKLKHVPEGFRVPKGQLLFYLKKSIN